MKILRLVLCLCLLAPLSLSGWEWQTLGFYKTFYNQYRPSLFNPRELASRQMGLTQGPHYSFSQYISVQIDWLSAQWQVDFMGTAALQDRQDWETDMQIQQFYLQKDFWSNWVLIAGRSLQRWGTGYAFNPTDVVAPEKELSDLDNNEKRAQGNDMVKLEYFGESFSVAFCYLTQIQTGRRIKWENSRVACRFYKNLGNMDLSLVSLFGNGETPVWGLNFAAVLGQRLEVHGEISVQKGSYRKYHRIIQEEEIFFREEPFLAFRRHDGKLYAQLLLGWQFTFPGNIFWASEYYHQGQGYSKQEWRRVTDYVLQLHAYLDTPAQSQALGNLLWCLNVYSPKGVMRDYWMNHLQIPGSGDFQFVFTHMMNLSDFSFVMIPQAILRTGNYFTFYARSFIFQGGKTSEFGAFFQSVSVEAGLRFRL